MTLLQKAVVIATVTLLAGVALHEADQTSRLQGQAQTLQQRRAPLLQQVVALKAENERLSNQLARIQNTSVLSQAERSELLRLRGQATVAQADLLEILQLKATLSDQNGRLPDYLMTQMAESMYLDQQREKKNALAPLARMKEALHLTDAQMQTVSNATMLRIERECELERDMLARRATSNDLARAVGTFDQRESELKSLLSPEQLAAYYPAYLQKEKALNAEESARSEAGRLAEGFKLSSEQQDKIRARLSELNLTTPPDPPELLGILQAATSSQPAAAFQAALALKMAHLEDKLKVLGDFLAPEQIKAYREERLQILKTDAALSCLLMPQPASRTK